MLLVSSRAKEDEKFHDAPQSGVIGSPDEHEQIVATSEVNGQAFERLVDVVLIKARFAARRSEVHTIIASVDRVSKRAQ